MTLEITGAEASIIDAGLVEVADAYGRLAARVRIPRQRDCIKRRIDIAEGLRGKLLVARYGEKRAAEIIAERTGGSAGRGGTGGRRTRPARRRDLLRHGGRCAVLFRRGLSRMGRLPRRKVARRFR